MMLVFIMKKIKSHLSAADMFVTKKLDKAIYK